MKFRVDLYQVIRSVVDKVGKWMSGLGSLNAKTDAELTER